jgi:hypothetical protein
MPPQAFVFLNGFALSKRFLPSLVDHSLKLNHVAPSLQPHYRAFLTTTRDSAPVPRLGTLALVGQPLELLPSHRGDRFPRSTQQPESRSRRLHAGRRLGSTTGASHSFRGELWTCARIALVIKEEFGVVYHKAHVSRLLKALG